MVLRINIHSHTVYYTSRRIKKKFSAEANFSSCIREWPEMWESCLLLMLFFFTLLNTLRLYFPGWQRLPPTLALPASAPNRTTFVVLSNQIQRPCYDLATWIFKEALFLISQASNKNNWGEKIWKAKLLYHTSILRSRIQLNPEETCYLPSGWLKQTGIISFWELEAWFTSRCS